MDKEERIKELMEHRELTLYDLRNANRLRDSIGANKHVDQMIDLYLDLLNSIDKELKKLI
jgi:ribonucleotide reductase alpha subunit